MIVASYRGTDDPAKLEPRALDGRRCSWRGARRPEGPELEPSVMSLPELDSEDLERQFREVVRDLPGRTQAYLDRVDEVRRKLRRCAEEVHQLASRELAPYAVKGVEPKGAQVARARMAELALQHVPQFLKRLDEWRRAVVADDPAHEQLAREVDRIFGALVGGWSLREPPPALVLHAGGAWEAPRELVVHEGSRELVVHELDDGRLQVDGRVLVQLDRGKERPLLAGGPKPHRLARALLELARGEAVKLKPGDVRKLNAALRRSRVDLELACGTVDEGRAADVSVVGGVRMSASDR